MNLLMVILGGIIVTAWATAIRSLRRWQTQPNDIAAWTYGAGFLTLALTLSAPLPLFADAIDRLVGIPGASDLLEHASALLTGLFWLTYLVHLNAAEPNGGAPRLARLAGLIAIALFIMSARFAIAPGRLEYRLGPAPNHAELYMAFYRLIYRGVFAVEIVHGIRLQRRYISLVAWRPSLRARLQLLTWLLVFTLIYISYECLTVIIAPLPAMGSRLVELRAILFLLALIAPSSWYVRWLEICRRWTEWRAWYNASRRLEPLWRALYPVDPSVSLLPSPAWTGAWVIWRDLPFRVSRQIVEIRDWSRQLRPYQVPEAVCLAKELGHEPRFPAASLPHLTEAAALAAALRVWSQHQPCSCGQAALPSVISTTPEHEVATLALVADLFAHSSIVRRVLVQLDNPGLNPIMRSH